nr:reverse transcriptase domain-containing protein [Tanacetum cinerariifolium]
MYVPISPEHIPAIPNQLPVEPLLAPNPLELDNDYLDVIDYDDREEPYEDLDDEDEEEDPEENPKMDLEKKEKDPEINIDDEEEEEPLPASPPPLSPLRTPPLVSISSSDFDFPVTTTINVGRPFKCLLPTYEVGKPSYVTSSSVFSARYKLNQLGHDFGILRSRVQSLKRGMGTRRTEISKAHEEAIRARRHLDRIMPPKRISNTAIEPMTADRVDAVIAAKQTAAVARAVEIARAVAAAETTRAAVTAGDARVSNNTGISAGAGGPNVAGPTVSAMAMNVVPEVRGCLYIEFMKCEPTKFKGTKGAVGLTRWFERLESVFFISKCVENDKVKYASSTLLDEPLLWWNSVAQPIAMVPTTKKLVERYVWGLPQPIQGNAKNAKGYASVATVLAGGRGYVGNLPLCNRCKLHHTGPCIIKCKNCQKGEARGKFYVLGYKNAQQDPNVVMGTFLLNNRYANILFDSGSDKSFVSTTFASLLNITPTTLDTAFAIELANAHITEKKSEEKRLKDVPIVRDFPKVFPEDLPRLPPPRQVEFQIELVPGAAPVARTLYHLALSEMK